MGLVLYRNSTNYGLEANQVTPPLVEDAAGTSEVSGSYSEGRSTSWRVIDLC